MTRTCMHFLSRSSLPQATVHSTEGMMEASLGPGLLLFRVFLSRGHNSYAANMYISGLFHCGVRIAAFPQLYSVGVVTFSQSPDELVSAAL